MGDGEHFPQSGRFDSPKNPVDYSTILSLEEVGKPHINIRWSDDGSDENERVYRYRLD